MPPLQEMVQALLDPGAYPDATSGVTLMQTQMSLIFLTHSAGSGQARSADSFGSAQDRSGQAGDYVYKVKKPVDLGYLDYTTLEKRRFFCEREVELNRRLCPDAYLGVFPITDEQGQHPGRGRGGGYRIRREDAPPASGENAQ